MYMSQCLAMEIARIKGVEGAPGMVAKMKDFNVREREGVVGKKPIPQ